MIYNNHRQVFVSEDHDHTILELKKRRIPFREVKSVSSEGTRLAIELTDHSAIII